MRRRTRDKNVKGEKRLKDPELKRKFEKFCYCPLCTTELTKVSEDTKKCPQCGEVIEFKDSLESFEGFSLLKKFI